MSGRKTVRGHGIANPAGSGSLQKKTFVLDWTSSGDFFTMTCTHGFGTKNVTVQCFDESGEEEIDLYIKRDTSNTVILESSIEVSGRCIIFG